MRDCSKERSTKIAAEYLTNGFNKVNALISAGYAVNYAKNKGLRLFDKDSVKDEIARLQAKTELKTDITVESIQKELEELRQKAAEKGDLSTAARCIELKGKTIAAFTDNLNSSQTIATKEITEDEREILEEAAGKLNRKLSTVRIGA